MKVIRTNLTAHQRHMKFQKKRNQSHLNFYQVNLLVIKFKKKVDKVVAISIKVIIKIVKITNKIHQS